MFPERRRSDLKDRNVRIALAYAMNFDKVIRTVLRNDYARMQTFNEGFGDYDNLAIHARNSISRRRGTISRRRVGTIGVRMESS
jgi:hypothetical protein